MPATAITAPATADGRDVSLGLAGAGVAVCAWSAGTILAKGIEMGGLAIGAYRFWIFSALIVTWMAVRRTPFTWRVMKRSMWGGIALGTDIALFFSAVKLTSIVNATIIGSLQPILVGVVAARFFGETIRARDAIWSLVALAGVVVIIGASADDSVTDWRGDLLAVGALLSWSGYFIASKQSKGTMTSVEFTAGTSVWSALICTPLGFVFGQDMSLPSAKNIGLLFVMIAVSGIVGHVLMNWSLVRIPLWIGSTFTLLIPVFSALLAWIFFDEGVLLIQGVAMAAVIGSLAAIVRNQSSAAKAAAAHKAVLHDGTDDTERTQHIDPIERTERIRQTEPTDPTDPTQQTNQIDQTGPTHQTDQTDQTHQTEQTDPTHQNDPTEQTHQTEQTEQVDP